jgi:hypothetical protein
MEELQNAINRLNQAITNAEKRQLMKDMIDVAKAVAGGILPGINSTSQADCQAWVDGVSATIEEPGR